MKAQRRKFTIRGRVGFDEEIQDRKKLKMMAHAQISGAIVASAPVDEDDRFELRFERMKRPPESMEIVISPPLNKGKLTKANSKYTPISSFDWKRKGNVYSLKKEIKVESKLIFCFLGREIKVCGVVCKDMPIEGTELTRCCPVPYAKVEVYDVDSLLFKLDTPYFKATDKIKKPFEISKKLQPEKFLKKELAPKAEEVPAPVEPVKYLDHNMGYIDIKKTFKHLYLYKEDLLGEVYTDECGEFCLTFLWFPGCINPDFSPDLIFKVSQTIMGPGGPETNTFYSEGGSDTRWDVPDYHWVKLDAAEDAFVACNPSCHPLLDRRALFIGVGGQEIYNHIEQGDDPARSCGFVYNGDFVKSPFGAELDIRAIFGNKVEDVGERYYRLSYAKINDCDSKPADDDPTAWTPITDNLTDTMYYWDSGTGALHYESVALGPHSLPGQSSAEFYKIRNAEDADGHSISWYDENLIAEWATASKTAGEWVANIDDGLYVLKLEIFDADGNPAPDVIIGDDEGKFAHMFLYVNNKTPIVKIKEIYNAGALINMECGSFEHSIGDEVKFLVDAYHEDDHLRYWSMTFQVGYGSNNGTVDHQCDGTVWGGPLLEDFRGKDNDFIVWGDVDHNLGLTDTPPTSCTTFGIAIQLAACAKTTNGYSFIWHNFYQEVHAGLAVHHSES